MPTEALHPKSCIGCERMANKAKNKRLQVVDSKFGKNYLHAVKH